MGEVADIIKAVHEVYNGGQVDVTVDGRNLGMAYAIPRGLEGTVVETYGPWREAEVKQVFYKESAIVGSVLAEIQMILTWRCSAASQYIIEAYLSNNVISIDPTVNVKIRVRFDQPQLYDTDLEAYMIPFWVEVEFRPIGSSSTTIYRGTIRADGSGTFVQN